MDNEDDQRHNGEEEKRYGHVLITKYVFLVVFSYAFKLFYFSFCNLFLSGDRSNETEEDNSCYSKQDENGEEEIKECILNNDKVQPEASPSLVLKPQPPGKVYLNYKISERFYFFVRKFKRPKIFVVLKFKCMKFFIVTLFLIWKAGKRKHENIFFAIYNIILAVLSVGQFKNRGFVFESAI